MVGVETTRFGWADEGLSVTTIAVDTAGLGGRGGGFMVLFAGIRGGAGSVIVCGRTGRFGRSSTD